MGGRFDESIPTCAFLFLFLYRSVQDPIVPVRNQWITEKLREKKVKKKKIASTVGWVAQIYHSWLSLGKINKFPMEEITMGQ